MEIPCATPAWGAWSLWTMSHPSHFGRLLHAARCAPSIRTASAKHLWEKRERVRAYRRECASKVMAQAQQNHEVEQASGPKANFPQSC